MNQQASVLVSVKQEGLVELTFTDRFVAVLANLEADFAVSKDSIFQWIRLFYEDNALFLNLFERSLLLIFQNNTYFNSHKKFSAHELVKLYSNLLQGFMNDLTDLEFQVKNYYEKQDYFENFLNFELQFFGQGLQAGKSFIKEFCFQMITSSLKILDEKVDIELQLNTQNQLLESTLYLLTSKDEENKKMGTEIYAKLKKIDIRSDEINELLLEYVEELQNYNLRKYMIRWGIQLKNQDILDRFLNRIKDKNPLIVEQAIQKLISEQISFKNLKFQQKIKLVVDGYGSHHQKVKEKMIQYLEKDFFEIFNSKQEETQEGNVSRLEEGEVVLQTLGKSLSLSSNRSRNVSFIQDTKNLTQIEKLIRTFNYDQSRNDDSDIFKENQFISFLICEVIFQVSCSCLESKQIIGRVQKIFHKIELYTIKSEDCIFFYSLLQGIFQNKKLERFEALRVQKQLKQYILKSNEVPSIQIILASLAKLFEETWSSENLTTKYYLLKIIELLSVHLDLYDCVGKRLIHEKLHQILNYFNFFEGYIKENNEKEITKNMVENQKFTHLQLIKVNQLMNKELTTKKPQLQVVTGEADLIFTLTGLLHSMILKQPSCQPGEIKLLINQLFENRDLKLERETMANMYIKTTDDIKNIQNLDIQTRDKKSYSHLIQIKNQIERKLRDNEQKIVINTFKAFYIFTKTLSIKEKLGKDSNTHLNEFKASTYIEYVKNFIYNLSDGLRMGRESELETCWLPYLLFYHYSGENVENLMAFKKLFVYYAFGQEHSLCEKESLLKLISIRILTELQIKAKNDSEKEEIQQSEPSTLNRIIENLMSLNFNDLCQEYFYQQVVLRNFELMEQKKQFQLFCQLLLFAIKEDLGENSNGLFNRILLLIFRKKSIENMKSSSDMIMQAYPFLAQLINEQKAVFSNEEKQLLMWRVTKIIENLISFIKSEEPIQDNLIKEMFQLPLTLKLLEIIPNQLFSQFVSQEIQKNAFKFEHIDIEILIFVKGQIQKSLEKLQARPINKFFSVEKELIKLQNSLETIEQKIGEKISSRLFKQGESNSYEQESTNHSLSLNAEQGSEKFKINFDQIDFYKDELARKIEGFKKTAHQFLQSIKKTNFYKSLSKDLLVYVAKYKIAHLESQNIKKEEIKEEEKSVQLEAIAQESAQTNQISVEFDRMGRRKPSRLEKQRDNIMLMQGSVKKSRYVVIPYDLVETAEEKYGKSGKSKSLRKRDEKDKSYSTFVKKRNRKLVNQQSQSQQISSQQILSQQISSQPESQLSEESQHKMI